MNAKIEQLTFYPIKGLSGQSLDKVDLVQAQGFPFDRAFGFARPDSGFDPQNPKPLPKTKFVVLAQDAQLATLKTRFNVETNSLEITLGDATTTFDTSTSQGQWDAAVFLSDHLGFEPDMTPTLYSAHPHRFTDVSVVSPQMMNAVSLINQDSVAAFSKQVDQDVSPGRFRGNIVFSGVSAFEELTWVDRTLAVGDVRLKVVRRTKRCAATEVNLDTGERDLKVPKLLYDNLGHMDMGIYAEVTRGGQIKPGDGLRLLD